MARRLNTYVHVVERADDGSHGRTGVFGPDDAVPAWAKKAITNPDVWSGEDDAPAEAPQDPDKAPPKGGAGSGVDAWRAFADAKGVTVPEEAKSREDVIAAIEAAGVPTE